MMHTLTEQRGNGHILSTFDSRLKIAAALAVLVMVLSSKGLVFPTIVLMSCSLLCVRMGMPLRTLALRFSEPLFFAIAVIMLKLLFSGKEAVGSLHILGMAVTAHRDGFLEGSQIAVRILGAASVVAALVYSMPFTELMAGLSWYRVPRSFIEILMFAYRAVYVLFEDAYVIYTAQKNRLGYVSLQKGLRSFGALAGALTIKAFDNSQNTTIAMVQRGYDGVMPMLRHKPFKPSEVIVSAFVLLVVGALWML
jgi:cobalt/nickel transport system permease protein